MLRHGAGIINHISWVRTVNMYPNATARTELEHTLTNNVSYLIAVVKYVNPGRFINVRMFVL